MTSVTPIPKNNNLPNKKACQTCAQYETVSTPCDDNSTSACKLFANKYINRQVVPEIMNNETCKTQCKAIMNSSGIYCPDTKACVCIDPSITTTTTTTTTKTTKTKTTNQCGTDQMQCKDGTAIQTKPTEENRLSSNYFSIEKLFGKEEGSATVRNAFCGCDTSVVAFYNIAFADTPIEKRPTLDSIWIDSVNNSNNPDDLQKIFTKKLEIATKGNTDDKLRALTAYEMCRITNSQYSRILDKKCPDPSQNFGGWLDCHLNDKESSSGKLLNRGVKILVMLMLVHVLFRTFLPKQGNFRDSLIFAMFMPPQFLQGDNYLKVSILGLSIGIMLIVMTIAYSAGSSKKVWGIFGGSVAVFSVLAAYGHLKDNKEVLIAGILGLIVSLLTLFVVNAEAPNNSETDSTDFYKPGDNVNRPGFWTLIGLLFLSLVAGIVGVVREIDLLKSAFVVVPALIALLIIIQLKPNGSNEGEAFIHYFIPKNLTELPKSGLAISIYAIIIGAIITKILSTGGNNSFSMAAIFVGILIVSAIAYGIGSVIFKYNDNDKDTDDKKESFTSSYVKSYFILLTVFIVISFILGIAVNNRIFINTKRIEYFIPYIISTVFGVLPLAMFSIIINFAIANYSPAIELLFLVIYRFSGFLVARNPNSGIGKIVLRIFGKRSTDKWVLPFLPFVSNFIELFYLITGDNKPGYFNQGGAITGVSNTDMWLS
jgi:hypothetical protein